MPHDSQPHNRGYFGSSFLLLAEARGHVALPAGEAGKNIGWRSMEGQESLDAPALHVSKYCSEPIRSLFGADERT